VPISTGQAGRLKGVGGAVPPKLGVPIDAGQTYDAFESKGPGEMTLLSAFPTQTGYFGTPSPLMVNHRVKDLDVMLA
jgi:hypothetical protein